MKNTKDEGLRALKRRLICYTAYADSRELKAAIRKFRKVNATSKHSVQDMILAHECGHAIVGLHLGMSLQFVKILPKTEIDGKAAGGGCGFLNYESTDCIIQTQMLIAGAAAAYKYCNFVMGESASAEDKLFGCHTDAGLIREAMAFAASGTEAVCTTSIREWDTALNQLIMGLHVTAKLSYDEIVTLRTLVQEVERILCLQDSALKALARAIWDNRVKDSEAYASITKEEIDAIWTSTKIQEN